MSSRPPLKEASEYLAEVINNLRPDVVCAYPITPQTHIVENLAKLKNDGQANYEYVYAESEFAAASIVQGATAAGSRSYTATSSQGLLLMTEVLYNIAGMRLPVVMTIGNRAIGAPINIWNDQQDSLSVRDSGWIQLYAENIQESVDQHIAAYRIAEQVNIPVMACLDGFILTHIMEYASIPSAEEIARYLPAFNPVNKLDTAHPQAFGPLIGPKDYMTWRQELHLDLIASQSTIEKSFTEFTNQWGRPLSLIEDVNLEQAETILVTMGSLAADVRQFIADQPQLGLLKISCFRPFPDDLVKALLSQSKAKNIAVLDKSIALGTEGIVATELRRVLSGDSRFNIHSFIMGLGGHTITPADLNRVVEQAATAQPNCTWII